MAASSVTFDLFARDRASGAFVKVGQAAQRAGRDVDQLGRHTDRLGGRFTALSRVGPRGFGFIATGAKAAALGLAGAAATAGVFGLKTAASMEQARIGFTTMLGSAQKADKFLKQLQQFAAQTPFEFPELQTAASSLISAGINANKVIPIMRTLGDVTAGMGTGSEGVQRATIALQQMSAAGKITGEDLNQLRDAGIPVFDLLAAATGKSKAQVVALAQAGKLGSKELGQLMKALETGKGLERFSGLMEKQSQSLSGLFSTLKDNVSMTLANLVTPAIPAIKAGLGFVANLVQQAAPKIQAGFTTLSVGIQALVAAFQEGDVTSNGFIGVMERIGVAARAAFGFFKTSVVPVLTFLARNFDVVAAAGAALGTVLVGLKVAAFAQSVQGVIVATRAWIVAQGGLNAALLANPVGIVVGAIAGLVAAFVIAYKRSTEFRNAVNGFAQTVMAAAVPALRAVGAFITGTVVPAVVRLWGFLAKNLGPTFQALGQLIVTRIWPALQGLFVRFQQVAPTIGRVIAFVAKLVGILLGLAVMILGKVLPVIIRLAGPVFTLLFAAIGKIIGIAAALARAFISATGTVIRVFLAMVGGILNGAARAFGWVPGIGGKLKTAAAAFNKFRDQVNAALDGTTKSRKITVTAQLSTSGGKNIGFATGGPVRGPGTGTSDSIPARLSAGEHIWTAREVQAAGGHSVVAAMRRSVVGYASGGPVVDPRLGGLPQFTANLVAFNRRIDAAARKLVPKVPAFGGSASVLAVAMAVARAVGRPGEAAAWARRIMFESGGNWSAVNRWDSNWLAGHPSVGGAQVIAGTFARYAGAYRGVGPFLYGVSINPFANSYAGAKYAISRYGSLAAVDPLVRPRGYRSGLAYVPSDNFPAMLHRGERVLTAQQNRNYSGGVTIVINGAVGNREAVIGWVQQALREAQRKSGRPVTI